MGLSMLFLRKRYPVRVAVALLPIMCGVFCAAYGGHQLLNLNYEDDSGITAS